MLRSVTVHTPRVQLPSNHARVQLFTSQSKKPIPPVTIRVPWLGTSTHHGTIEKIEKSMELKCCLTIEELGQFVKRDDPVLTITTDQGSAVQIKSPQNGVITKLNKAINDIVWVGNDLFELDESKTHDINPARIREQPTQSSNTGPQS